MKKHFSEHKQLRFGTSGLRDRIIHMTDMECYINVAGFIEFLFERGEITERGMIAIGGDRRESTPRIMAAVGKAVLDTGCEPVCCGLIPSPALAYFAMEKRIPSIMVTGSHIPGDRNGIKFTKCSGEVLKADEADILRNVDLVRKRVYNEWGEKSLFLSNGRFKIPSKPLLPDHEKEAISFYIDRYLNLFPEPPLEGIRLAFYQHSAVGRDIIPLIFKGLGAEVIVTDPSDDFIPVDTEKISAVTRDLLKQTARKFSPFAIISTDGDSDRPLLADEKGIILPGDKLGALAALYLKPDGVALPISSNDGVISMLHAKEIIVQLTRIGSPHVIKAILSLLSKESLTRIAGWEVNGGFIIGSSWCVNHRTLKALPTRDAVLPLIAVLLLARRERAPISQLVSQHLPPRYTHADIIDKSSPGCEEYTTKIGKAIIGLFQPENVEIIEAEFSPEVILITYRDKTIQKYGAEETPELKAIKHRIEKYFNHETGFGEIASINFLDGVKICFAGGDISHLRPSGNAPEFRIYATGNSEKRARNIVDEVKKIIPRIIFDQKTYYSGNRFKF